MDGTYDKSRLGVSARKSSKTPALSNRRIWVLSRRLAHYNRSRDGGRPRRGPLPSQSRGPVLGQVGQLKQLPLHKLHPLLELTAAQIARYNNRLAHHADHRRTGAREGKLVPTLASPGPREGNANGNHCQTALRRDHYNPRLKLAAWTARAVGRDSQMRSFVRVANHF